jgi:predicted O-methyltransferase YrrM
MSASDVSQALSSGLVEPADLSKNRPLSSPQEYIDQLFAGSDRDFLRSAISREEGRFLAELASRPNVRNTVEVGCANGVSSIYICAGISAKQTPSHTAIDPFQTSHFQGRGVANVVKAGFPFFELIEQPSEIALPSLLSSGKSFDMAFIDGLHTADQTLLDFYYLDRLIPVGGIIALDDVNARAVNKIAHYISTYQNYRLIGTSGRRGAPRRALNLLKQIVAMAVWPLRKIAGEAAAREFFDISVLRPEHLWTFDFCTMVAFEKTREYARDTNWYRGI